MRCCKTLHDSIAAEAQPACKERLRASVARSKPSPATGAVIAHSEKSPHHPPCVKVDLPEPSSSESDVEGVARKDMEDGDSSLEEDDEPDPPFSSAWSARHRASCRRVVHFRPASVLREGLILVR